MRYRLYSAWGLPPWEIVKLVFMVAVTFWVGLFALAGAVFVIKLMRGRRGRPALHD